MQNFGFQTRNQIKQTVGLRLHISKEIRLMKKAKSKLRDRKKQKIKHCQKLIEWGDSKSLRPIKVRERIWSKASRLERKKYIKLRRKNIRPENLEALERNLEHPLGTEENPIVID